MYYTILKTLFSRGIMGRLPPLLQNLWVEAQAGGMKSEGYAVAEAHPSLSWESWPCPSLSTTSRELAPAFGDRAPPLTTVEEEPTLSACW